MPRMWSRAAVLAGSTAFVISATLLQLLRQSGVYMWRTVWAEDGALFYVDAIREPLPSLVLRPYAGYALVVPRIVASVGATLPVGWYAPFVAVSTAAITSLLVLFVYFASAPLLRSRARQAVLAGALLLWPVLPLEISGVLANLQWMVVVPCLLAVLVPVERPTAIAVRTLIVVLAPLSSPLCVLLVPVAIWRGVVDLRGRRPRSRLVVPGAFIAASLVQVLIWRSAEQVAQGAAPGSLPADLTRLYATRVATEFVFGVETTMDLWPRLGYSLAIISVAGIAVIALWRWWRASVTSRWLIASFVLSSVVIYALSLSQRRDFAHAMVVVGDGYHFLGVRYQLFPAALLLLALLVPLDLPRDALVDPEPRPTSSAVKDVRSHPWMYGLVAVWFVVAFVPSYRLTTPRSAGPDWMAGVANARAACDVGDEPDEIVALSPPPEWMIALPCTRLANDK